MLSIDNQNFNNGCSGTEFAFEQTNERSFAHEVGRWI